MPQAAKGYIIELIVFVSGALVMVFEIAGSRVLGPYLGTSVFVWTSLIGIILGALSLGYYLGGKLADVQPKMQYLSMILLLSAVFVTIMIMMKETFLVALQQRELGIRAGAVIAATVLFSPTSVLLGMVSPYAVKLKMESLNTSGSTVGSLYALSTLGSIFGTFVAGFWLIPLFGTNRILLFIAVALAALSLLSSVSHLKGKIAALIIVAISGQFAISVQAKDGVIDTDTTYNRVLIYEENHPKHGHIKSMKVNNENSSAMSMESDELVYEYTKYYHLASHFNPNMRRALMIGGAAYSYPKDFLKKYPEATLDVVEIDPGLTELAREHFRLMDSPRLNIHHEDGRIFLNREHEQYDAILGDAFSSQYSLPYQLTTREAVQRKYDLLNENGVVIVNIISAVQGDKGQFLRAELATYKSVFPHVYVLPVQAPMRPDLVQNIALVALKSEAEPSFVSGEPVAQEQLRHVLTGKIENDLPILTDDYAPVDHYVGRAL